MENRRGRNQELPCKSMPNLFIEPDCEGESSLNPYALEFVPSHLKSKTNDNSKHSRNKNMKTEATSTTTLVQREFVGDVSYLHAQRQLFELLHQLGDKFMPLKAIKVSLAPDGYGINVQFKAQHGVNGKQILDENLCQDSALHLEMSDCSFIPRRLPNVLAANFMVRMGDVLNDKMEWNEESMCTNHSTIVPQPAAKVMIAPKQKSCSSSVGKRIHHARALSLTTAPGEPVAKKQLNEPFYLNGVRPMAARPRTASKLQHSMPTSGPQSFSGFSSDCEVRTNAVVVSEDSKYEKKKESEGIHTPRQSLGQIIKKGLTSTEKCAPRSTYTSQMRQLQVQKRMSLFKTSSN